MESGRVRQGGKGGRGGAAGQERMGKEGEGRWRGRRGWKRREKGGGGTSGGQNRRIWVGGGGRDKGDLSGGV